MTDQPTTPDALANRLRLAHQARRAKEHQLDDIHRALCDAGVIQDDDPYGHADLADVIRQTLAPDGSCSPSAEKTEPNNSGAGELRERYAAAMRSHYLSSNREEADADGNAPCVCAGWREPGEMDGDEDDWDSHLADAVLAVRDDEIERLRARVARVRRYLELTADSCHVGHRGVAQDALRLLNGDAATDDSSVPRRRVLTVGGCRDCQPGQIM